MTKIINISRDIEVDHDPLPNGYNIYLGPINSNLPFEFIGFFNKGFSDGCFMFLNEVIPSNIDEECEMVYVVWIDHDDKIHAIESRLFPEDGFQYDLY